MHESQRATRPSARAPLRDHPPPHIEECERDQRSQQNARGEAQSPESSARRALQISWFIALPTSNQPAPDVTAADTAAAGFRLALLRWHRNVRSTGTGDHVRGGTIPRYFFLARVRLRPPLERGGTLAPERRASDSPI